MLNQDLLSGLYSFDSSWSLSWFEKESAGGLRSCRGPDFKLLNGIGDDLFFLFEANVEANLFVETQDSPCCLRDEQMGNLENVSISLKARERVWCHLIISGKEPFSRGPIKISMITPGVSSHPQIVSFEFQVLVVTPEIVASHMYDQAYTLEGQEGLINNVHHMILEVLNFWEDETELMRNFFCDSNESLLEKAAEELESDFEQTGQAFELLEAQEDVLLLQCAKRPLLKSPPKKRRGQIPPEPTDANLLSRIDCNQCALIESRHRTRRQGELLLCRGPDVELINSLCKSVFLQAKSLKEDVQFSFNASGICWLRTKKDLLVRSVSSKSLALNEKYEVSLELENDSKEYKEKGAVEICVSRPGFEKTIILNFICRGDKWPSKHKNKPVVGRGKTLQNNMYYMDKKK